MFSTVAAGAKPENNMPAPNYKIQGPLADHTQQPSAFQKAATTAGANVLGKAGEAALFGVPGTSVTGMIPSLAAKGAAAGGGMAGLGAMATAAMPWAIPAVMGAKMFGLFNKGGSVGPLSPQYKEGGGPAWGEDPLYIEWTYLYDDLNSGIIEPDHPRLVELETILQEKYGGQTHVYKNEGGEIASLKEYLQELYARADAAEGWANDEIEATLIKIKDLEAQGFKKGGKAKPMYAGEGSYTFDPWASVNTWVSPPNIFAMDPSLGGDAWPMTPWEASGNMKRFPGRRSEGRKTWQPLWWNKGGHIDDKSGGHVEHKEHGGMTGPLSNNKSVKMEKKETIEYKN